MPPSDDVVIPNTWVTSRSAVEAFSSWCTSRKWIFQPTDGGSDFGKDGYVEVSCSGIPTGELFGVQVKGGASWRAAGGHRIPVGKHRKLWKDSTVPVIGIVHDGGLWWVNLTIALRRDPECSSVFVAEATEPVKDFETIRQRFFCASLSIVGLLIHATVGNFGGDGRRWRKRAGLAA